MSIRVRMVFRDGKHRWEIYLVVKRPNGETIKEKRLLSPTFSSKTAATQWAQARFAHLMGHGKSEIGGTIKTLAPTLSEFAPKFYEFIRVEGLKPSTRGGYKSVTEHRLIPMFGDRRLDSFTNQDVQDFKAAILKDGDTVKTLNNNLTVWSSLLRAAIKLGVISAVPCEAKGKKVDSPEMEFYEFDQYAALVAGAARHHPRTELLILLGGDAGLRSGELLALEWSDVDFRRSQITVARSEWKGHVTLPKGGKRRVVPMTKRLKAALEAFRSNRLRGARVLCRDDGKHLREPALKGWVQAAQRRAGLEETGGKHILRHTFCSHLAMRGATVIAIKELAGHASLTTTMRYMHLSPSHRTEAIALLNFDRGETMATTKKGAVTT